MVLPVLDILLDQGFIPDHQEVFRILLLSSLRKIEAARDHGLPVNYRYSIMGNSVGRVNQGSVKWGAVVENMHLEGGKGDVVSELT